MGACCTSLAVPPAGAPSPVAYDRGQASSPNLLRPTSRKCTSHSGKSTPCGSISQSNRVPSRGQLVSSKDGSIRDEYEMEETALGEGTQGVVRRAIRRSTGIARAVKSVPKKQVVDVVEFKREIQLMRLMDHPNIIKLFETFEDKNYIYLVMELCTGGELFDRIIAKGRLSEEEAAMVMKQVLRAVYYLHEMNVCHRDLKPENFLFFGKGPIEDNVLKLIDFGLACHLQPGEYCRQMVGTAQYVAPQVLLRRYDKRCDLWSCGVILYTLLSGKAAFSGRTEQDVLSKVRQGTVSLAGPVWERVSNDAKHLIRMLLRRNPAQRFSAEQALGHVWLRDRTPTTMDVQLAKGFLSRLQAFRMHNNLKKAALHAIADQLSVDETRHLREVFNALNVSENGVLTMSELRKALVRTGHADDMPDLEQILRGVDVSNNGVIDYTEFLAATIDDRHDANDEALWNAFNNFDLDGDGRISQKELLKLLPVSDTPTTRSCSATDLPRPESASVSGSEISDGRINFDDFVTLVRTCTGERTIAT
mmetsp:Transcript_44477/g.128552  ORF Transcript_44477/g.128552 Transcript_44477/m.128552 type:complete len:533 (-) Transcript_44477:95-1693(-)